MALDVAPTKTRRPRPLIGAAAGSALALVANTVIYFVANAIRGESVQASMDGATASDVPYVAVLAASIAPLLVGAAVLWVLSKLSRSSLRIWTIVALVLTVVSLAAPLTLPVDGGSKVALALMHIAAGTSAIVGQRWAASRGA
ncbi:MAG: DUF6069 family protein [Rhodoglobus sp.]